jgi:hypothetical protein
MDIVFMSGRSTIKDEEIVREEIVNHNQNENEQREEEEEEEVE